MDVLFLSREGTVIATADTRRRQSWRALVAVQKALRPHYRVGSAPGLVVCSRFPVVGRNVVSIHHAPGQRAYFSGVHRCANSWLCPLCAPVIIQYRRDEVMAAVEALEPGRVYDVPFGQKVRRVSFRSAALLTFTARHYRSTDPRVFVGAMRAARRRFANSRPLKALRSVSLGYICASEATWAAKTGLHFHFHELWFSSADFDFDLLSTTWRSACAAEGLKTGSRSFHGRPVDLDFLKVAGHYIAKEVAKTKKPLWSSVPPSDLFGVFEALRGRSRVRWSPGLRSALGLTPVLEDPEILEAVQPDLPVVLMVECDLWDELVERCLVPRVLELVETRGVEVAQTFLDSLRSRGPGVTVVDVV